MLHVVLVEPEIPWNTGNSGRSCLATGAQLHLVKPLGFSLEAKQLRRAGLDYWRHVDPRVHESFTEFERVLPELGQPFLFTVDAPRTLFEIEIPEDAVFLFGRESDGFEGSVRRRYAEHAVGLPIESPHVRSLNLSTCVGIAVYEYDRQRR
ncbi:MAG: tRNA (cytidine(34)-2'-O)-methyltransferase [Planctomycetota bacterium]